MKLIFTVVLSVLAFCGCSLLNAGVEKYDTLVDKDEVCNQKWSDYESQLTRRADMIPQLVEVVKGYAGHEQDTLTSVMQARASATQIKLDAKSDDFSNPEKFDKFQQAQGQLSQALGKLMMVQENYPNLKADAHFTDLMKQIEGTENRLNYARQEYNKSVMSYNTELRHVSGKVINPVTGHEFRTREYFKADESAKAVPKIDFSKPVPATSK